ncbi:MAG: asparaginase [candidate division WOR-3 bacterium]|nr:asparaginase [candidate division WOR-3 bacterium]MCX7757389.1 asparaginase [candidate division WOR-3 bacterium]MDW7988271.1 asparaginase domain-containing protein [candidate division WOR-3 bacterium]
MKIKIIATGGTFDKEYNELTGELFFKHTHVPEMLKLGRCRIDVVIEELMMVDSAYMTDNQRAQIVEAVKNSKEDRILITHGTDRMVETAQALAQEIKNKTVVLTGAMVPYSFGSSDGMFNLGAGLAFVQTLPYGVYIAMNGRYFHWNNVTKNKNTGYFEEISQ